MKTIRPGTFETNSSSCHTITINCTQKELEEFNEGKRWYFYNWDTDNFKRSEMFASLEDLYPEVAKIILSPDFENFKISDLNLSMAFGCMTFLGKIHQKNMLKKILKSLKNILLIISVLICSDLQWKTIMKTQNISLK